MNSSESSENFLHAVLESFVDGILVLTDQQEVMYANTIAYSICTQLIQEKANPLPKELLPKELQQVCEALVESKDVYGDRPIMIESDVDTGKTTFRIRAQWINLKSAQRPCILLRLQDQNQSVHGLAIAEAQKWNLTPRERDVWLLRRAGYKRKQIAEELYIAEETVKKHLKNIHFKRQTALDDEEWRSSQAS
ncbi:helix-turn-helix transcriptional regulator [Leptothermofonsia sp. ETS-13]|uniref:helix-turn-helix transcriptional regulator n=1 Tax=Leptothermofonsia sp. ETS-13 TaxID=3035696 RepID=UPI003BA02BCB